MKATVCNDFAPLSELQYAEVDAPEAKGSTVVIRADAIVVNYPDGCWSRDCTR